MEKKRNSNNKKMDLNNRKMTNHPPSRESGKILFKKNKCAKVNLT